MDSIDKAVADTEFCVTVPVGREDERLAIALRSLVAQKVRLNIALLDASGSDRVRKIAHRFENDLALRIHRPDKGQASAIREGWEQTSGDILCWLNADDALLPGALRRVAELFARQPETDVVYGHSALLDSTGRTTGFHMAVDRISDAIFRTNLISQPSCFVRRQAVRDVGGIDPRLHYAMDWDLWIRLYKAGKVFRFVDEPFSGVVWEKGTKTASVAPRRLTEIFRLVTRHAGPVRAMDTVVGVLSHHAANYTALAPLRHRWGLHHPFAKHRTIGGLDRNRRIAGTARIPVANLGDTPETAVRLRFSGAENGIAFLAVGDFRVSDGYADEMHIDLPAPVVPGEVRWVTVTATPGRPLRFVSAALASSERTASGRVSIRNEDGDASTSAVEPAVHLSGCTIRIPATGSVQTLKQTLLHREDQPPAERVVLRDVSLDAAPGDRIGIVGRNGVGKTSLLRLIAGIYPPSDGVRQVRGQVAPVLSLGRGLDPELSLRANVRLGLIQSNRNDLYSVRLARDILDFAELTDRADDPLRRLSNGMQARFAFSLSIHQAPDILLLDEIFTVGDTAFVEKAQAEIKRRLDVSPILFIASHDEDEIREVCSRAVLLHDGRIEMDSDPESVFAAYRKRLAEA